MIAGLAIRRSRTTERAPTWPTAEVDVDWFKSSGRVCGGFELAPLNLDLMSVAQRDAAVENLAALYDAIPGPFHLLSVPAGRRAVEHLDQIRPAVDLLGERVFRPYAANYHEVAAAPTRPPRRTSLLVDAASDTELARTVDLIRRVAEERGFDLIRLEPSDISDTWTAVSRKGTEHRIHAAYAEGQDVVAALHLDRRWPSEIAPGWLTGLLAAGGLAAMSMRVRPLSRAEAMSFMTTRLRVARASGRLAAERGEVPDVERERVDATAVAARRSLAAGAGRIYFADTVLLIEASDRASLEERLDNVRLEGRSRGVEVATASLRVRAAWASVLPGPTRHSICERNLDSASLAASLLHSASDLYEAGGHLYGRSRATGGPIVLDRFAHESHNAIVLGQTGKGKTMLTGAEMARCFMRGIRVLGVDPLGDYPRLTRALGGTYVELGASAGMNPFALGALRTEAAFAAKLASIARLAGAMAGGLSRDERPALDRAVRAAYEGMGIGPDPATHDRKPPSLADLVDRLAEEKGGQALARRVERWATGSLAPIFASDAGLPHDERFLVVGFAAISDPEVRAVAQLAALSVLWEEVRRDLVPKLVVVDEAWKVMRQPSGAEFIEELARSARHYHAGLQLSTQDIAEFLRSDFGEAIVKQCDIRVLLGQTPEGVDALARYFDLTAAERRSLLHARPGEGLLFVGQSHVAFEAKVSKREYEWLTTRPADLLGTSRSRYDAPNST